MVLPPVTVPAQELVVSVVPIALRVGSDHDGTNLLSRSLPPFVDAVRTFRGMLQQDIHPFQVRLATGLAAENDVQAINRAPHKHEAFLFGGLTPVAGLSTSEDPDEPTIDRKREVDFGQGHESTPTADAPVAGLPRA